MGLAVPNRLARSTQCPQCWDLNCTWQAPQPQTFSKTPVCANVEHLLYSCLSCLQWRGCSVRYQMCLAQDLRIRERQQPRDPATIITEGPNSFPTLAGMAGGCQRDRAAGPGPDEPWEKSSSQCVTGLRCHTAETARDLQVAPQATRS